MSDDSSSEDEDIINSEDEFAEENIITENLESATLITTIELAQLITTRASSISMTGKHYAVLTEQEKKQQLSAEDLALIEFRNQRCPLNILRFCGIKFITRNGYKVKQNIYELISPRVFTCVRNI